LSIAASFELIGSDLIWNRKAWRDEGTKKPIN